VPDAAVGRRPEGSYVFLVRDGKAEQRTVTVERSQGGESLIEKGVDAGDSVVVDGQSRLRDGIRVAIASSRAMSVSEIFVRRPVMTGLVMIGNPRLRHAGLPPAAVADLPNVDFPTIQVSASLPGASPETMAAAVATPLEKQFSTIQRSTP
jgi:HAE1 family hydrophobic/amphiphilic exporter-1